MLRKAKVVGKFVEFHGEGAASLPATDRATIANMAPEYGATMGFFPVDEETCAYLAATGRSEEQVELVRRYFAAQGMFGIPRERRMRLQRVLDLDLGIRATRGGRPQAAAGPDHPFRPQRSFLDLLQKPAAENGYGKSAAEIGKRFPLPAGIPNGRGIGHGDVLIASITSCTNTSNPSVMLAAGLLAKKASNADFPFPLRSRHPWRPDPAPSANIYRRQGFSLTWISLGFNLVGYGCMTCIGNSGPLNPGLEEVVRSHDLIAASVLSGNRNFEARVHLSIKANFLMSPPLVVAFALAGRVDIDMTKEPLGKGKDGAPVYLRDIWPGLDEIKATFANGI